MFNRTRLIITDVIMIDKGKLVFFGPLEQAKKLLNNDLLILETSNNNFILENINKEYISNIELDGSKLNISTSNLSETKKQIIKLAYENNIDIITLMNSNISLEEVYSKILTDKVGD